MNGWPTPGSNVNRHGRNVDQVMNHHKATKQTIDFNNQSEELKKEKKKQLIDNTQSIELTKRESLSSSNANRFNIF